MKIRTSIGVGVISLALLGMTACGDDDDGQTPVTPPPGGCTGHGCNAAFALNEGGEARIELYYLPDGTVAVGTHAYFFKDQMPGRRELPRGGTKIGTNCYDMRVGNLFDNGNTTQAQQIASTRRYLNVGANVTIKPIGGGTDIVLGPTENAADPTNVITHDLVYLPGMNDMITRDIAKPGEYTVVVPGSADFAAKTFGTANNLTDPSLGVPADFTSVNPSFPPANADDKLQINPAQDYTITWTAPASEAETETFIVFWDAANNSVSHTCLVDAGEGTFTIPKDVLANVPAEGGFLHAIFTHRPVDIGNGQRFDLLGTNCHYFNYQKM
jgi:hypothetical protein